MNNESSFGVRLTAGCWSFIWLGCTGRRTARSSRPGSRP